MPIAGFFELFKIGMGPSSSHTMGPMTATARFVAGLVDHSRFDDIARLRCRLRGSLALTGEGHGTTRAVILGLSGHYPETFDPARADTVPETVARERRLTIGGRSVDFDPAVDIVLDPTFHPAHPNALTLSALDAGGSTLVERTFLSIGGGFIREEGVTVALDDQDAPVPHPFRRAAELLAICAREGMSIPDVVFANEAASRGAEAVEARIRRIDATMSECVARGISTSGKLPGPLGTVRRAPDLNYRLETHVGVKDWFFPEILEAATVFAIAVNEENAAFGRVVTAPTNGAAGVVPGVLSALRRVVPGFGFEATKRFFMAATAFGGLAKRNASISGAEVGCQGEVGVAAAMAAAGATAALGGDAARVENAAEIALEHHLGLTCDPVGGLVQIPCIERNAVGATKALNAAMLALNGSGSHRVSFDVVLETMRKTGVDMRAEYKETAMGGLAVHVAAVEC